MSFRVFSCPVRRILSGVAASLILASGASSQSTQPPEKPKDVLTFGASTEMVYVRFHIEKKGEFVKNISKSDLRVFEDGKPQEIAVLETPSLLERSIPVEVTLLLDVSSSVMDAKLLDEALIKEVLLASLSQSATVSLCAFGGELRCPAAPTRDVGALMRGFQDAIVFGAETRYQGTRLYASVSDVCTQPKSAARVMRALVIFSDGLDNQDGKVKDAIEAATAGDVRVYAVKVSQAFQATSGNLRGGFGGANRTMYDYKKFDLDKLAAETGGQAFEPGTLDKKKLAETLRKIATEITMENVLGFEPRSEATGKKRKIRVELIDKAMGSIRDGERNIVR